MVKNDGGVNLSIIYFMYCGNFCKCRSVPPSQQQQKNCNLHSSNKKSAPNDTIRFSFKAKTKIDKQQNDPVLITLIILFSTFPSLIKYNELYF